MEVSSWEVNIPIIRYSRQVIENGTTVVLNMRRILLKISVLVSSATKRALVETGEQRSPKKTPDKTAPPTRSMGMFMAAAIVVQITPMVAAVPKAVPVRKETAQFRRKAISKNREG